jgi:hypothetical protein
MTRKLNIAALSVISVLIVSSVVFYIVSGIFALATRLLFSITLISAIIYGSINYKRIFAFFRRSGSITGAARIMQLLVIFGIMVFIYIFSPALPWKLDLTRAGIYSLTDETTSLLRSLTNDINVYCFKSPDKSDVVLDYQENLLKIYSERCGRIKIKTVDPNVDRIMAGEYNITENGTVVFECRGNRAYAGIKKMFSSDPRSGKLLYTGEAAFTGAIKSVISGKSPDVYILQGHGEINTSAADDRGYSGILEKMTEQNIRVKILNLLKYPDIPRDCGTLVIGDPTHSFSADELDKIDSFINGGGSVLVLVELETHETINDILRQMGLYYYRNLAVEDEDYAVQYGKTTIIPQIVPHEITMPLIRNSLGVIMPSAAGIFETPKEFRASNDFYIINPFLKTSRNSYGEVSLEKIRKGESLRDRNCIDGPLTLGCSARKIHSEISSNSGSPVTNSIESRMIVFGDIDFINNANYNTGGNSDLFLNSLDYLLKREALITIRPKSTEIAGFQLSSSEQRLLSVISVAVFLLYIIPGIVIVIGRRRRIK